MGFQYDEQTFTDLAEFLKVLGHPIRLCILKGLLKEGATCPSEIQACLNLPQSTLSQHLARLRRAGLITGHRRGLEIHYSIVDQRVEPMLDILFSWKGAENED